jgi:hypothetical protein
MDQISNANDDDDSEQSNLAPTTREKGGECGKKKM